MNMEIREMHKDEAQMVWKTGRPSFGLVEGMAFKKPEQAFLAIIDGKVAGMASYRIYTGKDNKKIGYVETGYVKKGLEGNGIGSKLYEKATLHLKENGCETVTATVKDDNAASWKLFENNGYHITGYVQMLHNYGLWGTIRLWFHSTLAIASGFHLWSTIPVKEGSGIRQISAFVLFNLLILLPALLLGETPRSFAIRTGAIMLLLAASLLGGFIATIFSKETWHFRTAGGGMLISVLITVLGGIWPVVGRFYPEKYQRSPEFRRSMGLEGLFEWLFLLMLTGTAEVLKDQWVLWNTVKTFGVPLLLIHSIPVYPFECFGGKRIWDYSKGLSALTILISGLLLFLM